LAVSESGILLLSPLNPNTGWERRQRMEQLVKGSGEVLKWPKQELHVLSPFWKHLALSLHWSPE
jgi:hypothetical protein